MQIKYIYICIYIYKTIHLSSITHPWWSLSHPIRHDKLNYITIPLANATPIAHSVNIRKSALRKAKHHWSIWTLFMFILQELNIQVRLGGSLSNCLCDANCLCDFSWVAPKKNGPLVIKDSTGKWLIDYLSISLSIALPGSSASITTGSCP